MDVRRSIVPRRLGPLFLATIMMLSGGVMGVTQKRSGSQPPESQLPPGEDKKKQDQKDPPSLDDLLGIKEEKQTQSVDDAANRAIKEELERQLNEKQIADALQLAIEGMSLSAEMLDTMFDPGLGTQRIQEDIIDKLQQLIDQAKKMSNSSSSSSSSSSSQQQQPEQNPGKQSQQQQGQQDGKDSKGNQNQGENDLPPKQEGALNPTLEELGSEWGQLPERIRNLLLQGRREKYSSLYKNLTSEYYRRLAESGPN